MYSTFRQRKFLCTLWSLALAKKYNINNSRAQVSRPYYFLWLCINLFKSIMTVWSMQYMVVTLNESKTGGKTQSRVIEENWKSSFVYV